MSENRPYLGQILSGHSCCATHDFSSSAIISLLLFVAGNCAGATSLKCPVPQPPLQAQRCLKSLHGHHGQCPCQSSWCLRPLAPARTALSFKHSRPVTELASGSFHAVVCTGRAVCAEHTRQQAQQRHHMIHDCAPGCGVSAPPSDPHCLIWVFLPCTPAAMGAQAGLVCIGCAKMVMCWSWHQSCKNARGTEHHHWIRCISQEVHAVHFGSRSLVVSQAQ